jgi:hypothetical protein
MLSALNGQGFGILSQQAPEKRFLLYWLYSCFNRYVGEWALQLDGTAPYHQPRPEAGEFAGPLTPVLATLSPDGREIYHGTIATRARDGGPISALPGWQFRGRA